MDPICQLAVCIPHMQNCDGHNPYTKQLQYLYPKKQLQYLYPIQLRTTNNVYGKAVYEPSISNSYAIQTSYTLTHVVCSWEFEDLIFKFQKYLFIHIFSEIQINSHDVFLSGKYRPIPIFYNHLTKQFQRRTFLEINQPETKIAYGSHVC